MAYLEYFRSPTHPYRSGSAIYRDVDFAVRRAKRLMRAGAAQVAVWHEGTLAYRDKRPAEEIVVDAEKRLAEAQANLDSARRFARR